MWEKIGVSPHTLVSSVCNCIWSSWFICSNIPKKAVSSKYLFCIFFWTAEFSRDVLNSLLLLTWGKNFVRLYVLQSSTCWMETLGWLNISWFGELSSCQECFSSMLGSGISFLHWPFHSAPFCIYRYKKTLREHFSKIIEDRKSSKWRIS